MKTQDPKIPVAVRRERCREITKSIAAELDARGVTDEDIERDFASFRQRRSEDRRRPGG